MHSYSSINTYSANKGSALAIGLTILTAITLISVSSLQRSGIQGRMVGSIQHQEQGFHAANGELEEIYQFYATQASATQALSAPLNSFEMIAGDQVVIPVDPGHDSTYSSQGNAESSGQSTGYARRPRLDVISDIQHTGLRNSLLEGFSVGTFVEYGFEVNSQAAKPSFGITSGRTLSSQVIGIKFIAPAG
jgi:hypothetical protein